MFGMFLSVVTSNCITILSKWHLW